MDYDFNYTIENYLKTFKVQPDFYSDSESSAVSDENEYESLKPPMLSYEAIKNKIVRISACQEENVTNIEETKSINESADEKKESDNSQMNRIYGIREIDGDFYLPRRKICKKKTKEEYELPTQNSFSLLTVYDVEPAIIPKEPEEVTSKVVETKKSPNKLKHKTKSKNKELKCKNQSSVRNETKPEPPALKVSARCLLLHSQRNSLDYLYKREYYKSERIKQFMLFVNTTQEMCNIINDIDVKADIISKNKKLPRNYQKPRYKPEKCIINSNNIKLDMSSASHVLKYLQESIPKPLPRKASEDNEDSFQYLVDCTCSVLQDSHHEMELRNNRILERCFKSHDVQEIISSFNLHYIYFSCEFQNFDNRISLNFVQNTYATMFFDSLHTLTKTPIDLFATYDLYFDSTDYILSEINKYSATNKGSFFSSDFRDSNRPNLFKSNSLHRQLFYCKHPPNNNRDRFHYLNMLQMVGLFSVELMSKSKRKRIRKAHQKLVSKNNNSNNKNCHLVFNSSPPLLITKYEVSNGKAVCKEDTFHFPYSNVNFKESFVQISVLFLLLYFTHFILYGPVNC